MKFFKRFLSVLFIHLSCFQLAFAQTIVEAGSRKPAQLVYEVSFEELGKRIEAFKTSIAGREDESHCPNQEASASGEGEAATLSEESHLVDEVWDEMANETAYEEEYNIITGVERDPFYKYLKSLKVNACGQYVYTWDSEAPAEQVEECRPRKIEGFIDRQVKEVMELEKEEKEVPPFKLDNPRVRQFNKEAQFFLQEVRKYLANDEIEESERRRLLVQYLDGVVMPMRDLVVVMRAYTPHEYDGIYFYESLLPDFSASLFPEDDLDNRDLITLGPNPSANPFFLEIEYKRWGKARLRFKRGDVLARDILTILKAPTAKNYVRALKWMTLHMMLQQVFVYDSMLGTQAPVKIPRSCQNHFNADLPEEFTFQYAPGKGREFVDNLLASRGLIFKQGDYKFMEYYMDNIDRDPTKEGYSGLMPFEQYKAAVEGLKDHRSKTLKSDLDDYTYFDQILNLKRDEVMNAFKGRAKKGSGRAAKSKPVTYRAASLMEKILNVPKETDIYSIKLEDGEEFELEPALQNLSVYLAETMQRNGVGHFEDLITGELERKLESTTLQIPFPSLYGSTYWRQWALTQLREWVQKQKENGLGLTAKNILNRSCLQSVRGNTLCRRSRKGVQAEVLLTNLQVYLKELISTDEYVPTRRLEEEKHKANYQVLANLWRYLRDFSSSLPQAKPSERDYLVKQMKAGNPWARIRFSYLVAQEELRAFKSGHMPQFRRHRRLSSKYRQSQCFFSDIESLSKKLKIGAEKLGVDRSLTPHHGNELLEREEKEYLWDEMVSGQDPLFKELDSQRQQEYYRKLEKISYQTLLTKRGVEDFVNQSSHISLRDEAWKEIEQIFEQPEALYGKFFYDLYKLKGKPEEQAEIFQEFSEENGIDNKFMAKMNFLAIDNTVKRTVLSSVVREAAQVRKNRVMAKLKEFCEMEPHDHESLKTLFYATSKSQNKLNELAGAPAIPAEVLEKINSKLNSMSPDEWTDLWLGLGAGLLGVAAMLIGGACTGLSGGLCAPLGIAMMAAGASAMTMQMTLISREFNRKTQADVYEQKVKEMEELGFANVGSSDSVSRSWFWTTLESFFIIPLIGVTARSLKVGSKATYILTAMMMRNTGKVGFKQAWKISSDAGKTIVSEEDVALARLVLGLDRRVAGKMVSNTVTKVKKIQWLFSKGKISADSMAKRIGILVSGVKRSLAKTSNEAVGLTSKVVVKESSEAIDAQTAKMVARYFGHNPRTFQSVMKTYVKKLDKATRVMAKMEGKTKRVGRIPVLGGALDWVRKLRMEQLAKHADNIKRIHRELGELAVQKGSLENYVLRNIDDLTDIFIRIPVRKRELPYMFFLQGGPHVGGLWKGSRVGYVYGLADGLILRKFFNARSRLIYESFKAKARQNLGLTKYVASETTLQSVRAFQESVAEAVEKMGKEGGQKLVKEYQEMEIRLAEKVLKNVDAGLKRKDFIVQIKRTLFKNKAKRLQNVSQLDKETLRRILFAPENDAERALADVVWESVEVDDIFDLREVGDVAYRVVRELSQYENVGEFDKFLNALKVLVIKRDPGVVEIM